MDMLEAKPTKYRNLSIPQSMFLRLARLVGHHGFTSVTEVAKWAIRKQQITIDMWLEEIEKLKEETGREFGHDKTA